MESTRCWGHYVSSDLLSWKYKGIVLDANLPEDKDGVFSGSAVTLGDHVEFFYTGNVMEDGDYDYVLEGRGANVIFTSLLLTARKCHRKSPSQKSVIIRRFVRAM